MTRVALSLLLVLVITGNSTAVATPRSPKCSRDDLREVIKGFITAFNDGDFDLVDRSFAKGENFEIYRVNPAERVEPDAYDRSTLLPYFQDRYSKGDQLKLLQLFVGKPAPGRPGWGFSLELRRTSDELGPFGDANFSGKGNVKGCRIVAVSLSWQP